MRTLFIVWAFSLLVMCAAAHAGTYVLAPNPSDLGDLDHNYAYQWCFNSGAITWPATDTIIRATLHFENITNSQEPENDRLAVYLLQNKNTTRFLNTTWSLVGSNSYSTAYRWYDAQNTGKPFNYATWPTAKNQIMYPQIPGYSADGYWRDTNGVYSTNDVDFAFDSQDLADLIAWSADGNWAIGIDPDCHYSNCGVSLIIETKPPVTIPPPIPEPISMILAAGGLGCIAALRRFRR